MPRSTEPRPHEPVRRTVAISAGAIQAVFSWRGDRWGHRILVEGSAVWESVEGPWPVTADPRWPASPVLVEIDRLGRGGDASIVAVGLAGRSHFSASISCVAGSDGTPELLFELACRVLEPPGWLGSSYTTAAGHTAGPRGAASVPIRPIAGCRPAGGDEDDAAENIATNPTAAPPMCRLRAAAGPDGDRPGPATIAWSYRVGPGDACEGGGRGAPCDRPQDRSDS